MPKSILSYEERKKAARNRLILVKLGFDMCKNKIREAELELKAEELDGLSDIGFEEVDFNA